LCRPFEEIPTSHIFLSFATLSFWILSQKHNVVYAIFFKYVFIKFLNDSAYDNKGMMMLPYIGQGHICPNLFPFCTWNCHESLMFDITLVNFFVILTKYPCISIFVSQKVCILPDLLTRTVNKKIALQSLLEWSYSKKIEPYFCPSIHRMSLVSLEPTARPNK